MTPEQTIELAKQAGAARFYPDRQAVTPDAYLVGQDFLQRFYELVRNEVLEEAAKVCESLDEASGPCAWHYEIATQDCATAIKGLKS